MGRMELIKRRGIVDRKKKEIEKKKREKKTKKQDTLVASQRKNCICTHPSRFTLIFESLLGILCGCLHVIHSMFHVVLNAVDHLTLYAVPTP